MTLPLFASSSARPTLRPYQEESVAAILDRLKTDRATLLVLATGLGKTVCFSEVVRRGAEKGRRSLILAHRTELLDQAADKLRALGLDVGHEQADRRAGNDSAVVASVQTLQRQRLERWARDHFALIVIDEAHHAAAASYRSILDHFESAKVLGVTATPDRGDKKGLHSLFDSVAYRYEIAAGIKDGWLAPLSAQRVVVNGLDLSAVRTTAGDLNQGDLDLAMRAPEAVHGVAEPVVKLSGDRQTLVFGVTVEHARALADAINELAPGTAMALDVTAPRDHRAAVLQRYHRGDIRVLCNCALFTEGFDAPSTACIAIARPTKSRALYAQMVGRGTRLAEGKANCLILDFAGLAGKHNLIGPADVLVGKELDDDARLAAERMLQGGEQDLFLVLDEADEVVRRKRERKAPDPIAWTALEVQLFGDRLASYHKEWEGLPMTDAQAEYLERKGIDYQRLDKAQASALIDALKERQADNLCTFKQAKVLGRYGIQADRLSFEDASMLIDGLAKQNWRPNTVWVESARRIARGER